MRAKLGDHRLRVIALDHPLRVEAATAQAASAVAPPRLNDPDLWEPAARRFPIALPVVLLDALTDPIAVLLGGLMLPAVVGAPGLRVVPAAVAWTLAASPDGSHSNT